MSFIVLITYFFLLKIVTYSKFPQKSSNLWLEIWTRNENSKKVFPSQSEIEHRKKKGTSQTDGMNNLVLSIWHSCSPALNERGKKSLDI